MTEPTPDPIEVTADGHVTYTPPEPVAAEPASAADAPELDDAELDPRALAIMQKLRRENQSLRSRLHEREEEVGAQAARETVRHIAAVEAAAAAAGFYDPADFTLRHPDPAPFLDEQFQTVIGDRVKEAAEALLAEKPHLGRPVGPPPTERPLEGLRPGARALEEPKATSWASALHGRR